MNYDLKKDIKLRKDKNNGVVVRIPCEMVRLLNLAPGQVGVIAAIKKDSRIVLDFEEARNEV